jgi:hypothetical protein
MMAKADGSCYYPDQLDFTNIFVVSVSKISEEQLLCDPV